MDIRDAVAEVIYKQILAHPGQWPKDLVDYAVLYRDNESSRDLGHEKSQVWKGFREALQDHAGELPEICTENG